MKKLYVFVVTAVVSVTSACGWLVYQDKMEKQHAFETEVVNFTCSNVDSAVDFVAANIAKGSKFQDINAMANANRRSAAGLTGSAADFRLQYSYFMQRAGYLLLEAGLNADSTKGQLHYECRKSVLAEIRK